MSRSGWILLALLTQDVKEKWQIFELVVNIKTRLLSKLSTKKKYEVLLHVGFFIVAKFDLARIGTLPLTWPTRIASSDETKKTCSVAPIGGILADELMALVVISSLNALSLLLSAQMTRLPSMFVRAAQTALEARAPAAVRAEDANTPPLFESLHDKKFEPNM